MAEAGFTVAATAGSILTRPINHKRKNGTTLIANPRSAKGSRTMPTIRFQMMRQKNVLSAAVCRRDLLVVEANGVKIGGVAIDGINDGALDFVRSLCEHVGQVRFIAEIHVDRRVGDGSECDRRSSRQRPLLLPVCVVGRRASEAALDIGRQRPHGVPIGGILGGTWFDVVPDVRIEVQRHSDVHPHLRPECRLVVVVDSGRDDLDPLHSAGSRSEGDPGRSCLHTSDRRIVDGDPFWEDHHQITFAERLVGRAEHLIVSGGSLVLRLVGRDRPHELHDLLRHRVPPDHIAGDETRHPIERVRLDEGVCEPSEVIRDAELRTG